MINIITLGSVDGYRLIIRREVNGRLSFTVSTSTTGHAIILDTEQEEQLLDALLASKIRAMAGAPQQTEAEPIELPADVRRLVIAARKVAFATDIVPAEAMRELDQASEAFASRVPWDDQPDAIKPSPAPMAKSDPASRPGDQWYCGNGHLAKERVLRIVEANSFARWDVDALAELEDLAQGAGPDNCRAAIERRDQIPF